MRGHALVVEDRRDWRDKITGLLEGASFDVKSVATLEDAVSLLRSENFHLAVVDISLKFEDAEDESGMNVLDMIKELKLDRAIRTVVVSAYGTTRRMRRAFVNYNVDDFIDKEEFDSDKFLDVVAEIFEKKAGYNPDLEILPKSLDLGKLLSNMQIGGERIRRGSTQSHVLAPEVSDLLKRLFHRASSIVVSPISGGYSGAGILRVKPVYPDSGVGTPLVVKFGDSEQIEREHDNFKENVEGFVGQGRSSSVIDARYTTHLGGIIYSFLGTDIGQLTSFEDFYAAHTASEIREVLADLFEVTTATWYANRTPVMPMDIISEYLSTFLINDLEELEDYVFLGKLKRYRDQGEFLQIPDVPDKAMPQPFGPLQTREFLYFTTTCTTHGDLNANNLLIDREGKTWLIDYYRTGLGHILRDCVELEAVVKYILVQSQDMAQLYALENRLSQARTFEEAATMDPTLPGADDETQKAYTLALYIRQVAHRLTRVHGAVNFGEYQVAMAMYSLNLARLLSLPVSQRIHALMGASLALRAVI